MRIFALLSWWDEQPEWLAEMVESVAPFVDGVVAVDGPYPLTPHESEISGAEQYAALEESCETHGLELHIHSPGALAEVDKRAFMFRAALSVCEPMDDWFLIMDGDMYLGGASWPERARWHLEGTDKHAAEVTFHNLDPLIDSQPKVRPFRSLFRAIPGLMVEGLHSMYTVPNHEGKRLLMWQQVGTQLPVDALDLSSHIHLYHRPHLRDPERLAVRADYYERRSVANIESTPEWA